MKLKVYIDNFELNINIGQGLNDFVWLSLTAAKLYGKLKHPAGNYLPCMFRANDIIIHPREKIVYFMKSMKQLFKNDSDEWFRDFFRLTVELYQPNYKLDKDYQLWFDQAFGSKRNLMTVSFHYTQDVPIVKQSNLKGQQQIPQNIYRFYVKFPFQVFKELQSEYKASEYNKTYYVPFKKLPKNKEDTTQTYEAEKELPLGKIDHSQIFIIREQITKEQEEEGSPADEAHLVTLQPYKGVNDIFNPIPKYEPEPMELSTLQEQIKQGMKIPEKLSQQLQQQEAEIKKEVNTGSFCPFEFSTLWEILLNQPRMKSLIQDLQSKIQNEIQMSLEQHLNKLYEIFFQYSMLHIQNTDKKEDIAIPFQDVLHFIKFYMILDDQQNLFQFVEVYDKDDKRCKAENPKLSLDLSVGVQFPEFLEIIICATDFYMTSTAMRDKESHDTQLKKILTQIEQIDGSENDLNDYQKHMKYNITLMNFIRENSEQLYSIFLEKLIESKIDNKKFHLQDQQVKSLIADAGFVGNNIEDIVQTCKTHLQFNDERFQMYDGLFYYEFLQVMQWLALVLITDAEDEEEKLEEEDPEEGVEQLIEKFRFFLSQFNK